MGLSRRATVYGENAATGLYDQVVRTELPCRLLRVAAGGAASAGERAELLQLRRFQWDPDVVLPEGVQVVVDGVRYQLQRGTYAALVGPAGGVSVRVGDAVRQV